jgi:hypothetical protein
MKILAGISLVTLKALNGVAGYGQHTAGDIRKFTEHRKLDKPFSYFYDKDMKAPIGKLKSALDNKDLPAARSAYTLLTNRCNGCHDDHDIYKEVKNWVK